MFSRRDFLLTSSLLALAPTVPAFLAHTARAAKSEKDARVLVVVQLDGGNDGLNTLVPFADDAYGRLRTTLRLPTNKLIKIDDGLGLHPALGELAKLLESRRLAIVQGVGYPNPSRSHARSMAIWHTARFDPEEHTGFGWLGRALDENTRLLTDGPASVFVGHTMPPGALRGRRSVASALDRLDDFRLAAPVGMDRAAASDANDLAAFIRRSMLDAYTTVDRVKEVAGARDTDAVYPTTPLADRLKLVARMLKSGFAARVYYATQPGYDTHSTQLAVQANLLSELAGALRAFLDDLAAARLADRVALLCFSEFGRTVRENASAGTDHGTAAPLFLAGPGVHSGLAGTYQSLTDLENGEPKMTVDFRRVYASVLENWLRIPGKEALGGTFEPVPLFWV